jgi:hypothetical protein
MNDRFDVRSVFSQPFPPFLIFLPVVLAGGRAAAGPLLS